MAPTDIQECCEKPAGIETSSCGGKMHKPRQRDFDEEIGEATDDLNTSIRLKLDLEIYWQRNGRPSGDGSEAHLALYGHICLEVLELRGHIQSLIRQKEASMRDDYSHAKTSKNRT